VVTLDANYTLQSLVRTKTTGADGSFNLGRVSDPKLDSTIDALKIASDPQARDPLLREALVTVRDQHYYVPLHHQLRPWAMKKGITPVYDILDRPQARFVRVN
jgi:peptide/nickel transport system substrate-binding protein